MLTKRHLTRYLGHDIIHAGGRTGWYTVSDSKLDHYFVDLRSAMDFVELHWNL